MTAALNLCAAAYTQRPFRTPQRPVPGRRSRLSAPPEPHACFAASKAAFSSSFIRPCFAAVNAVFHLFCARAVPPTASPPQGAAPVQAAAEWPPSAPSMENAAVPATAANIAATRRRYQPVTAVPSGAAAHALQKQASAAAEAATPIHQPAASQPRAPERAYNAAPAISADTSAFHKNAFRNTRLRSIAPPPFPVSSVLHSTWI